jgi:hypothetical protein
MNVFPFAGPSAFFSDVVDYQFRIRPASVAGTGAKTSFAVEDREYRIACRFAVPVKSDGGQLAQKGVCATTTGQNVSFQVNDEIGATPDLRVFAGRRLDPFFFDAVKAAQTVSSRKLSFEKVGTATTAHRNVLSIIVEIDASTMFAASAGPLFAAVCETVRPGSVLARLERFGRPGIKNLLLRPKDFDPVNRDIELRDLYNQEDAFELGSAYIGAYRSRLNGTLAFWDGLDGNADWPVDAQGTHPLTELLLADFMVVDASKPYAKDSSLEIESKMLAGFAHESSGGRSPNDDYMETFLTLLVNRGNGPRISDGVDKPTVPSTLSFPHLVPPEPDPSSVRAPVLKK